MDREIADIARDRDGIADIKNKTLTDEGCRHPIAELVVSQDAEMPGLNE